MCIARGVVVTLWIWFEFLTIAALGAALSLLVLTFVPQTVVRGADRAINELAEKLPLALWRLNSEGRVIWSNAAYKTLAAAAGDPPNGLAEGRLSLSIAGETRWFDIRVEADVGIAHPLDDLIRAEAHLRDMVQAMAKTFAQLPTGLAVFDHTRHLQSFNPALVELTGLSPEFLSRRPSLIAMLDVMRDRSMVPEPKNWKHWRQQIADMERAAASGQFEDTWALPGGQTYRVSGRRHPDGGLALMIDDISSEIIRSRRYRADLDLSQRVVDTLEEGIAVFAPTGQLVMSNTAYAALWGHDPAERLAPVGFSQLSAHWRALSAPTTLWAEAEDFAARLDDRAAWQGEARLLDGRLILCRFSPLSDGATLVGFRLAQTDAALRALIAS